MRHAVLGALVAARAYLREQVNGEPMYGFFPGGDPRDFSPDEECSTEEERARHREHCAAWDRGERPGVLTPQCAVMGLATHGTAYPPGYGLGVYSFTPDDGADDVLDQVNAAIAALESEEGQEG